MVRKKKIEFGDFQTPIKLTNKISEFIKTIFPDPVVIVEPTCGLASFVKSFRSIWKKHCTYYGFDINPRYITKCNTCFKEYNNCHFGLLGNELIADIDKYKKYHFLPLVILLENQ